MKATVLKMSVITTLAIFLFAGTSWADGGNNRHHKKVDKKLEVKFNLQINDFVNKIDSSINQFRFNVSIALFYELYKLFKDNLESQISSVIIKNNMIKIKQFYGYEPLEFKDKDNIIFIALPYDIILENIEYQWFNNLSQDQFFNSNTQLAKLVLDEAKKIKK